MTYSRAIRFLDSLYDREKSFGRASEPYFHLRSIARLLHKLGRPQRNFRSIHIVGTKGKGSISAFITSALLEAGFSVGTYTSPHLCSPRERIAINGNPVGEEEFADAIEKVSIHMTDCPKEFATYFEALTAAAFLIFAQNKIDWAIVEAGLGGIFDATNAIVPEIVVISKIGLDHTEILGSTLEKIAVQKAGVIKPNCIVVSSPQEHDVKSVIIKRAEKFGITPIFTDEITEYEILHSSPDGIKMKFRLGNDWTELNLCLAGDFQAENFITSMIALLKIGVPVMTVVDGCKKAKIRGRMEKIFNNPLVIVDGAHNVLSARATANQFLNWQINPVCVVAINRLKDFREMIREWASMAKAFVFTKSSSPRCYSPGEMAEWARNFKKPIFIEENPRKALEFAKTLTGENGAIFVTGSFYLAAELICSENKE